MRAEDGDAISYESALLRYCRLSAASLRGLISLASAARIADTASRIKMRRFCCASVDIEDIGLMLPLLPPGGD